MLIISFFLCLQRASISSQLTGLRPNIQQTRTYSTSPTRTLRSTTFSTDNKGGYQNSDFQSSPTRIRSSVSGFSFDEKIDSSFSNLCECRGSWIKRIFEILVFYHFIFSYLVICVVFCNLVSK
jgi:hypothetical protein